MELSTHRPSVGFIERRTPRRFTLKKEISVSTLLQIAGMLLSAVWFADRFAWKQEAILTEMRSMQTKLDRIEEREERVEKYLSSKDPHYWQTMAELSKTDDKGEK